MAALKPTHASQVTEAGWYFFLEDGTRPHRATAHLYQYDPKDACLWRNSDGCGDVTVEDYDIVYGPIILPER